MDFSEKLSVITPVSRPSLLPMVALSVPDKAEWLLVTDGPQKIPRGLRPHILLKGPKTRQWGDVQRQMGLEAATRPFVYFLDDDNLMLPTLADLLIPYLETGNHAGLLFGLLVLAEGESHLWPPPLRVEAGHVDTAMFFGRRESIVDLRFHDARYGHGWPDLRGERGADFICLKAFDDRFGLSRLPAIYGFHNGIDLLRELEPECYADLEAHKLTAEMLAMVLTRYMIAADVPPWW